MKQKVVFSVEKQGSINKKGGVNTKKENDNNKSRQKQHLVRRPYVTFHGFSHGKKKRGGLCVY